jgi:DNA polymerase-3 subunit beta
VLFLASADGIRIRATNLDLGIEVKVQAKVEQEGVIALPADILGNYLSFLPAERSVSLELIGETVAVSGATSSTVVKGAGYEDFPTLPIVTQGASFQVSAKTLATGLRMVSYSAATTDMKPEFAAVYCYSDGKDLVVVATDSSRLAEKRIPIKHLPERLSFLVPAKNVQEIIRVLEAQGGEVEVLVTKTQVGISGDGFAITSRLVDGNFPDYRQIIPKQEFTKTTLLRGELQERLKVTGVFSGKLGQVRLKVYPEDAIFEVESRTDEIGETTQRIDVSCEGDSVEVLLNQRYVSEVLAVIGTDSLSIGFSGSNRPVVIRGVGDHSFLYMIMPIRG